jgi:hypothetical protein
MINRKPTRFEAMLSELVTVSQLYCEEEMEAILCVRSISGWAGVCFGAGELHQL